MAEPTWHKAVIASQGNARARVRDELDHKAGLAVALGIGGVARTGTEGLSVASRGGRAVAGTAGIAVSRGVEAQAGDDGAAYGYDGTIAVAGNGGIAFSAAAANARAGNEGIASVYYNGGPPLEAQTARRGVSVVRFAPASRERHATAVTGEGGVAIAAEGGAVRGGLGALLAIRYVVPGRDLGGFTSGVVDGRKLHANVTYILDEDFAFRPREEAEHS